MRIILNHKEHTILEAVGNTSAWTGNDESHVAILSDLISYGLVRRVPGTSSTWPSVKITKLGRRVVTEGASELSWINNDDEKNAVSEFEIRWMLWVAVWALVDHSGMWLRAIDVLGGHVTHFDDMIRRVRCQTPDNPLLAPEPERDELGSGERGIPGYSEARGQWD